MTDVKQRVLRAVDDLAGEVVDFTAELVRLPTVNPPGEAYEECARVIGGRLERGGFAVEYVAAEGRPEHTARHPRLNVMGRRAGRGAGPVVHLNGHFDVVPAGGGWTVDPFGGEVRDGRIWGRGTGDMKAGLAAAIHAAEALRRAGAETAGALEVSGTVDEESGGFAGVAFLARTGRIARGRTDYVIIPEPLGADRICIGHRGVWWFEVELKGRIAHGSMPFLGVSAIEHMAALLEAARVELQPALAMRRTAMPVVPEGAGRATLNVNAVVGGQPADGSQTPCVADRCRAVFDRRFLLEEGLEAARAEVLALLETVAARIPGFRYEVKDLMVVHPVRTPEGSPLVTALGRAITEVRGKDATLVASPGTYDQKHVARIAGVEHCVAYGPGVLELAHQPDEWCSVQDLIDSTKVLALAALDLTAAR
ncbi:MAG: succinyl-diaminopimelate desuccinylase [Acidobacteria bacterium]|nr:MAG: succinyl-diaminopimelate desuccinylase [Acidobacteriota bacterium]PYQ25193.1 MAG: succinyl-diaminopimelate desuccinylase [Acidobacteriota bacterium]